MQSISRNDKWRAINRDEFEPYLCFVFTPLVVLLKSEITCRMFGVGLFLS